MGGDTSKKVNIDSLKVILLTLYITKLINKTNKTNFDIYWNILINTNLFQVYDLTLVEENKAVIINYLNTISFADCKIKLNTLEK